MDTRAWVLAAIVAVFVAAPCSAAPDLGTSAEGTARPTAYVGGVVRLELGRRNQLTPIARLRLGVAPFRAGGAAAGRTPSGQSGGIEVGLHPTGQPELYVGGRSASQVARLDGSTGTAVQVVFGVALLAVGLLVITNLDDLGDSSSASTAR